MNFLKEKALRKIEIRIKHVTYNNSKAEVVILKEESFVDKILNTKKISK